MYVHVYAPRCTCMCIYLYSCSWAKVTIPGELLSRLLPGPVTTVFERSPALYPHLNPGVSLVGIRIPEHGFVRRLVEKCGVPLALTSANVSATQSTLSPEVRKLLFFKNFSVG